MLARLHNSWETTASGDYYVGAYNFRAVVMSVSFPTPLSSLPFHVFSNGFDLTLLKTQDFPFLQKHL